MMSKVESINSRKVLGAYCDAQNNERLPEEAFFVTGVILTVVCPQIIFYSYGGIIPLIALSGSALVGTLLGLSMHRQSAYRVISTIRTGNIPQAPTNEDRTTRKAA